MNEDERKDYESGLFGPVIFSYTDEQAVEDGVLFDVVKHTKHGVNRITAAVYELLGGSENEGEFPSQYHELEDTAAEAMGKSKDKEFVEFQYRGKKLWMMDNETGGKTIMFPEDY